MFKTYNQGQNFLLPPNFKEFIGESHESIILDELINELDISKLIGSYSNENIGASAYHPRMLLKIMIYAYMNKTFSSRKIASKLKTDLAFMYLAGNNQPKFKTINNFRKDKGEYFEDIFIQIVLKAKKLGMINFGTLSLDGTKIYANASKNKNTDEEKITKKIKKLIEEADKIDSIEDGTYGKNNENIIPDDLKTAELRLKKKEELKKKELILKEKQKILKEKIETKKEQGINQTRINSTDEDSRLMKMKRKDWGNGYNPQNITENQFVISTNISNNPNDTNELIPAIQKLEKQYGVLPKKLLADAGYGTEKNYKYNEEKNIESYIPHPDYSGANLDDFKYDKKTDTYENKEGNIFKFKQFVGSLKPRKKGRPKKDEILKEGDFKAKLYFTTLENGKKKYLQIVKNVKDIFKRNDKRLYSEEGKGIYKKRSGDVEVPFGNIKFNLGFERFSLRGFSGVQNEWNLINIAHNMGKLMKFGR